MTDVVLCVFHLAQETNGRKTTYLKRSLCVPRLPEARVTRTVRVEARVEGLMTSSRRGTERATAGMASSARLRWRNRPFSWIRGPTARSGRTGPTLRHGVSPNLLPRSRTERPILSTERTINRHVGTHSMKGETE